MLEGHVVVIVYLGGEPFERRHGSCTVIGLAFILLDVYPQVLDVHGIADLVQLTLYSFGVTYQGLKGRALGVFGQMLGKVTQPARGGFDVSEIVS